MIGVSLGASPAVTLGNVRRNRHRGTPHLTGQSVLFAPGKRCGQPVALLNQVHSPFPGLEISVCEGCPHAATMSRIDAECIPQPLTSSLRPPASSPQPPRIT